MTLLNNASRALLALTLIIPGTAWAASSLPSTPYTRSVLRAADAPAARTALGIANSNWSVNVAQFTVGAGSQLTISTQALMTNVNIYGTLDKVSNIAGESNSPTLYVSMNGNNATAVRGNPRFPFLSLSNAVAASVNGDTIRVLPGFYTNESRLHRALSNTAPINVTQKTNLTIDCTGAYFYLPSNWTFMSIWKCSNVWIRGGTFDNTRTTWPYPQAVTNNISIVWGLFEVADSHSVHARDMTLLNVYDHGWLVDPNAGTSYRTFPSTNGSVIGCTFRNCGGFGYSQWDGDAIIPGAGWIIANNDIAEGNRGIEVYPIISANGIPANYLPATVITGNKVSKMFDHGICAYFCPVVISGNTIWTTNWNTASGTQNYGLQLAVSPSAVVSGNSVRGYYMGINIATSTNALVANNIFEDCLFGSMIGAVRNLELRDNRFLRIRNGFANPAGSWVRGTFSGNVFTDCQGESTTFPGAFVSNQTIQFVDFIGNTFNCTSNTGYYAIWNTAASQEGNVYRDNSFSGYATNLNVTLAPPIIATTNSGAFWHSNNTLFWTWTAGGTTTNTVKVAGP